MRHLKKFEGVHDYPYFEITEDDYSNNIQKNHRKISDSEMSEIMMIIHRQSRYYPWLSRYWYRNIADNFAVQVFSEIDRTVRYRIFKSDDDYFFVWGVDGRFWKCDEMEGFRNFAENELKNIRY